MTGSGKSTPNQKRDEKRATALRENLKRRKAGQPSSGKKTDQKEEKQ